MASLVLSSVSQFLLYLSPSNEGQLLLFLHFYGEIMFLVREWSKEMKRDHRRIGCHAKNSDAKVNKFVTVVLCTQQMQSLRTFVLSIIKKYEEKAGLSSG